MTAQAPTYIHYNGEAYAYIGDNLDFTAESFEMGEALSYITCNYKGYIAKYEIKKKWFSKYLYLTYFQTGPREGKLPKINGIEATPIIYEHEGFNIETCDYEYSKIELRSSLTRQVLVGKDYNGSFYPTVRDSYNELYYFHFKNGKLVRINKTDGKIY